MKNYDSFLNHNFVYNMQRDNVVLCFVKSWMDCATLELITSKEHLLLRFQISLGGGEGWGFNMDK